MKYIQFDSSKLPNLEFSLFKEVLQTNHAGTYMSTTITGCNTRKYHGLLVCPIKDLGGHYVMLSSMQCSILLDNNSKSFNLGVQQYEGDIFQPKGHKYLVDYEAAPSSTMTYRVGGVTISQQFILSRNEDQLLIRYTAEEAPSSFVMRLKPFLAFRNIHELTHQNMQADTHYNDEENGVSFCLYKGFPRLFIQGSKSVDFVAMPDWYKNVEYIKERYRGYGYSEDLYVPGYFEFKLKQGESVIISASLDPAQVKSLKSKFSREVKARVPKENMKDMLINAAQQFPERQADGSLMLKAGFLWKDPQLRDTFLSLAGLQIFQDDKKPFLEILNTAIKNMSSLYIEQSSNNNTSIDVPLWFFYCINELERFNGKGFKAADYYDVMKNLLDHYWNGVPGKMHRQDNGLIYARQEGHPQTWMNAKTTYGHMVTPRYGCAVEVNALWYNAIATTLEIAQAKKDKKFIETWQSRLEQVGQAFLQTFAKEDGTLYDRVDDQYKSPKTRPNQVIAAGLKFSPLSREQKKAITDVATAKLLTPRGLRTIAPDSEDYHGAVEGNPDERAMALHQGTAYTWLLGFYADAMIAVYKNSCVAQLRRIVEGIEPAISEHGIGSLSECYNGNPPYVSHGAISMACSVAAALKLIHIVESK